MERHQRLKTARERHFRTAKDAAASLGLPYGTYSGHESGSRGIKDDELQLYARRFHVPLQWLAHGIGDLNDKPTSIVTIVGRIGAGAQIDVGVEQIPESGDQIETVLPLPAGAIGFEVVGDSMWPRYDPGDVIVCDANGIPLGDLPEGEEAAVRTSEGLRYLKRVYRGQPEGFHDLISHNAAPIKGAHLDWAADVIAIIRATKWRRITDVERRRLAKKAMAPR